MEKLKDARDLGLVLSVSFLFVFLAGCVSTPKRNLEPGPRVTLMTYNVENLFDTAHDEGKDDYTFLPRKLKKSHPEYLAACEKNDSEYRRQECIENDWNDRYLGRKLDRIADVIEQIDDGRGPDIQFFAEVENKHVLEMLRSRLKKSNYSEPILIEGPDNRGIDPGILTRLAQWGEPELHIIPFKGQNANDDLWAKRSRGILEAKLILPGGQKASVFAIHFPSQGNPAYLRKQAIDYLNELESQLPNDVIAIAGGDFNITSLEDRERGFFKNDLKSHWLITHQIGCKDCDGSYYYHPKREWSFFDAILFQPSMQRGGASTWIVDPDSIRVPSDSRYQVNRFGTPARFDAQSGVGVSDHWPMYAEIYAPVRPIATAPPPDTTSATTMPASN